MSSNISIRGLNKAKVLAALYNAAQAQGMGFMAYNPMPMSEAEAKQHLERESYFDYLNGRVMKVDLSSDEINPWLYDRDNGQGAVERVIKALRQTGDVNPEEVELLHLENTHKAAEEAMGNLGKVSRFESDGKTVTASLGLGEFAEHLRPKLKAILAEDEVECLYCGQVYSDKHSSCPYCNGRKTKK